MAFDHINYVRSGHPDLTHRQMAMMILIQQQGQCTVRGLAAELAIQKPAITRGATTLQALGLIHRVRDITDRRNVFLVPTPDGAQFVKEAHG